jgi:glutaredoxin
MQCGILGNSSSLGQQGSPMSLSVYGIPNCGTCKKAIAWLEANDIAFEFINTKDHPPKAAEIAQWVEALGNKPMRNTSGQSYLWAQPKTTGLIPIGRRPLPKTRCC